MSAMITPDMVRQVITTVLDDQELFGLIALADVLIESRLGITTDISDNLRAELSRFIAAHYVAGKERSGGEQVIDRDISSQTIGEASISYGSSTISSTSVAKFSIQSGGLESTWWGRQALALDPTGQLRSLEGSLGARLVALL